MRTIVLTCSAVLSALAGSFAFASEKPSIVYTRLSIEQNNSLFNRVLVGLPKGKHAAFLSHGKLNGCVLTIFDADTGNSILRLQDLRHCIDVEYEDGSSLYNMPEFIPFLKANHIVVQSLLKQFDIDRLGVPNNHVFDDPKVKCLRLKQMSICGKNGIDMKKNP